MQGSPHKVLIIIIITSQYKLQEIKHIMIHVYENRFKRSIGVSPDQL